ncbi:MAG: aminopeptidase P family protein [Chloroflexi bacterium]|nr:aminopeptidase P family protein [Chloroflexota bacterium]
MLLNKERALGMMKEAGLSALIATQPENVAYLTNHAAWMVPGSYVYRGITLSRGFQIHGVLTPDGARTLIIRCGTELTAAATFGWQVDDLYVYGTPSNFRTPGYTGQREDEKRWLELYDSKSNHTVDAVSALIKALRKQGVTRGRVAIEFANLAPDAEKALRAEFGQIEFVDAGDLLARVRYVKTPDEIARLRRAASVNETAVQEVMKAIRPGVTELEMKRLYRAVLAQEDSDLDFFMCSGGLRAGLLAAPGNYAYKPGDQVMMEFGCRVDCYHADTGACGVLGEPVPRQKEMWRGLCEVWNAGISALRPGVRPSRVFDIMAAAQQKAFGYVTGYFAHGIGLECREGPFVNKMPGASQKLGDVGEDPPFEAGMVICVEIPMQVLGFGCVHREETFLITPTGCEPLVHTMRDLYVFGS